MTATLRRIIPLLLLLVACGGQPTTTTSTDGTLQQVDGFRTWVKEITLSDGTPCAVVAGGTGVGIDCDWQNR